VKFKKNQLILIEFLDIEEDPTWQTEERACQRPDCDGIGVGFYLKHDKEYLYCSTQIIGTQKPQRNKTVYPLGCIKRIKKIKYG
jgi:hypothetical protein